MTRFFHQLRLLLWKNFIIKKRSLHVFMFELTVPLVLFLIMVAIRNKQHAKPVDITYYNAWPLPSAGFVPLMQSFCKPENGIRNEFGFLEYPNSTAKEMLVKIEKILNSNWSLSWFTNTSTISPYFQNDKPTNNLNELSRKLAQILRNNSKFPSSIDKTKENRYVPLNKLIKLKKPNATSQIDNDLNSEKTFVDLYELFIYTSNIKMNESTSLFDYLFIYNGDNDQNHNETEFFDKEKRIRLMHEFFCDKTNFKKVISSKASSNNNDINQERFCNMTQKELSDLDDNLVFNTHNEKLSFLNQQDDIPIMDSNYVNDLNQKLNSFIDFQDAIDDLSLLSIHFPTGLCDSKSIREKNSQENKHRPESLINTESNDSNIKKRLMKNHGFLGIWMNMQKTFCGVDPPIVNNNINNKNQTNADGSNSTNKDTADQFDSLNLSPDQLKSVSLLFQIMYSNPIILYSPNTTVVTENLIRKSNSTFELIDKINLFFRQWLDTSDKLVEYLRHEQTNQSLSMLNSFRTLALSNFTNSSNIDQTTTTTTTTTTTSFLKYSIKNKFILEQLNGENGDLIQSLKSLSNRSVSDLIERIQMIDSAACSWLSLMSGVNLNLFKGFTNESELVNYFLNSAYSNNQTVIASIVFQLKNASENILEPHLTYKIRQNASFTYTTKKIRERYWYPSPRDWDYYYYLFGFVWLQDLIDRAIIDYHSNKTVLEPGSYINQMPYPCYTNDNFLQMIQHVMPLCLSISFVYTIAMLSQTIVYEKELRLKEVMKIMGLNNSVHLFAWFITYFIQFTLIMFIVTFILHYGKILTHSNPFLIFLLLEIYAVSIICFSFLISSLYSKAKLAAACAGILYFLSYVPCMYISIREDVAYEIIPWWTKTFASLLSTSAFGIGSKYIAFYENNGAGIQFNNLRESPLENDTYNCFNTVIIMVIDCVLYLILAWYIENVNPSYGIPLPWNYPLKLSYWFPNSFPSEKFNNTQRNSSKASLYRWLKNKFKIIKGLSYTEVDQAKLLRDRLNNSLLRNGQINSNKKLKNSRKNNTKKDTKYLFEQEPLNLPIGVSIQNLTKKYSDSKLAVDNLSINFYESQITSFLGHNGAGKTTTMSMLTGLIPATTGHALIYGKDICTDINTIRNNLGWCPQHNVLFDKLTVEEHLWFYAKLKHVNDTSIRSLIENMLRDTGLKKKRNNLIDTLSGGMQRKLSVAIAFVGDANLVILDEPTAGVDPYARRAIWDLLLKYKQNRTIILSTHHMDEAELLGDRIAIISNGKLQCCGTALFLKNALGEGNHLTITKSLEESPCTSTSNNQFETNSSNLINFMRAYVPSVFLKEETLREYQLIIPLKERSNQNFWNLFNALEENKEKLKIDSYGIHDVSLEEIFLKAAQIKSIEESSISKSIEIDENKNNNHEDDVLLENDTEETDDENESVSKEDMNSTCTSQFKQDESLYELDYIYSDLEKGYRLYLRQFFAIVIKRYLYNKRNWKSLLTQIILPALFICIAMTVALSAPGFLDLPPLELSPAQFYPLTKPEGIYVPYSYASNKSDTILNKAENRKDEPASTTEIIQTLKLIVGLGSTCVLNQNNLTFNDIFDSKTNFFEKKYFGKSDQCQIVFNQNADINFDYFKLKNTTNQKNSFLQAINKEIKKYYPDCKCFSDFSGFKCSSSNNFPDYFRGITHETLLNISGENESEYYLYTTDMYRLKRYGGLSFDNERPNPSINSKQNNLPYNNNNNIKDFQLIQNLVKYRNARVWYNNKGFHAIPTFLNVMNNQLLRANVRKTLKQNDSNDINLDMQTSRFGITIINHPMNQTNNYLSTEYLLQGSDVLISIFTIVAMSFVNASFVLFLVYERSIKSLHLQFLIGLNPLLYWITNFLWDMLNYMLPASCVIIIFKIFDVPAYVGGSNYPAVILLFLFYGWSVSPLMYPLTFIFKEPSNAYIFLIVINLFTGITCVESSFLLQVFSYEADLKFIYDTVKSLFLLFPPYCLGRGLIDIAYNDYYNSFYSKTGQFSKIRSPFEWDITTRNLLAMACIGCISWLFTLLLEYDFFKIMWKKIKYLPNKVFNLTSNSKYSSISRNNVNYLNNSKNEDPDVNAERVRIENCFYFNNSNETTDDLINVSDRLIMRSLRKVYEKKYKIFGKNGTIYKFIQKIWNNINCICCLNKSSSKNDDKSDDLRKNKKNKNEFVAVESLTFGVPAGECFGLLGVNGAGKTTTFKMLTTDLTPTDGNIYLTENISENSFHAFNALSNKKSYWNCIGYCPQFDALYDELTPSDHIRLFARLKGVRRKYEEVLCQALLKRLDLIKYTNIPVGSLSLGNKRKLSTALALVSNPSVVLLDEPTSGMDPVSRRRLWQEIINLTRQKNRSVLLTSHSMEECEVLCTRLAMMVDGKFKCMGSVQHLKTKFGDGYTLTIKLKDFSKQYDLSDLEEIDNNENLANTFINNSNQKSNENFQSCKNKYINLILKEIKEKICSKCKLKERHFNNVFQFELPYPSKCIPKNNCNKNSKTLNSKDDDFCIGDIYRLIELNKLRFNIADYSLSQNTLDNVFINFVKEQTSKKQPNGNSENSDADSDDELIDQHNVTVTTSNRSSPKSLYDSKIQFPIHDTDLLIDNHDNSHDLLGPNSNSSRSSSNYATISSTTDSISDKNKHLNLSKFKFSKNNLSELFDNNGTNSNSTENELFDFKMENMEIIEDDYC